MRHRGGEPALAGVCGSAGSVSHGGLGPLALQSEREGHTPSAHSLAVLLLLAVPRAIDARALHHPTAVYAFPGVTRCSALPPETARDYTSTLTVQERTICGLVSENDAGSDGGLEVDAPGFVAYRLWVSLNPERAATITGLWGDAAHPLALPPAGKGAGFRSAPMMVP